MSQPHPTAAVAASPRSLADLLSVAGGYLPAPGLEMIEQAYGLAEQAHEGMVRRSGEPYVQHPLAAAMIVADMHLDAVTIVSALLHDVVEDTAVRLPEIRERFGPAVAHIVDGVTKFEELGRRQRNWADQQASSSEEQRKGRERAVKQQAENIKKMFLAMAEDPRVVLVKLADRLHNMRTLGALPEQKQQRVALETREIYAPLAGRLGMAKIKWELEDTAFRYLEPDGYAWVIEALAAHHSRREEYIQRVTAVLQEELARAQIQADVLGRVKHIYSIYKKLLKSGENDLSRIYDLFALRVLVESIPECYQVLGVVHSKWPPLPARIKDYIAMPKPNGYQSLHTTVLCEEGLPTEVQIRSREMHNMSEYGVATHWHYKEQGSGAALPAALTTWIAMLRSWQEELTQNATDFVDTVKIDVFQDQVFVSSPKGDIIDLPARSTPVDFAYRVHTQLGHRCIGAKVNGLMVPLDYQLQNGDRVEILTTKTPHGPSRDWLNFVASASAREKIRQWFKRQHRDENIARGRDLIERELGRLDQKTLAGMPADTLATLAGAMDFRGIDDLFAAVGYGAVSPQGVAMRLVPREEAPSAVPSGAPRVSDPTSGQIRVMGVGDLLTRLAGCCQPAPGDQITGYITRNHGITIHRATCARVLSEQEAERLVQVDWGRAPRQDLYNVTIVVRAWDRDGLLRDVSASVTEERVSIASAGVDAHQDGSATIHLTLRISNIDQLSRVFSRLERVRNVYEVRRDGASRPQTA
ncbi:MAG TPA: bifunctional (p)ppGpp synthetase/guanosine-3',5'-bis(diphosphate) 3'-pyrophosphohydrolase [Chloroflexota bacterium]|nr:bifunctional (p)ppGpp synthetase/guanosine-3',5'-bis(diphosphate) 3'-pyrophosphohydrolase [Chloroflexota bacterium]